MNLLLAICIVTQGPTLTVGSRQALIDAVGRATPGTTILVSPGTYSGGISFENLHGSQGKPVVIAAEKPSDPPRFVGGSNGMQLSKVSYLELRDLTFEKPGYNGLNIDDGGSITVPSHHVTLRRIRVSDLPKGNHDGIKLSGIEDFRLEECEVARWGGSAVDMVGCHRGVIIDCSFKDGGDSGVQNKGGTSQIHIQACHFLNCGERSINIGGSTGEPFFRPSVAAMGANKYEARDITVEGCTVVGSVSPIAFVGVDRATVRFNTLVNPGRWALRILQETQRPGFVPSQKGAFTDNLVAFNSNRWSAGGVNVGGGTRPETFTFARNFWICEDQPNQSKPNLPTPETDGTYGVNPRLTVTYDGKASVAPGSPASKVGAHAWIRPR